MIGETQAHYRISGKLGAGGMAEVYRAQDLTLGREVAIKVLLKDVASDPDRERRFEQEARAASALNHPNIVQIYEIGSHESIRYMAMELVEGATLRSLLSDGPLDWERLLPIAEQLTAGLAKAHSAGIVHRDLKPENVMVTPQGFVKVLDFGLAQTDRSARRSELRHRHDRKTWHHPGNHSRHGGATCHPSKRRASLRITARTSSHWERSSTRWRPARIPFGETRAFKHSPPSSKPCPSL